MVWVAYCNNQFAGYVTLVWKSEYESFSSQNIPEIKDLNVLSDYRKLGIVTQLIKATEAEALRRGNAIMGIGVGLFSDYGSAQRLYFKLGYQPDGRGVTHNYKFTSYDEKSLD